MSQWHGYSAQVIENQRLRVLITPDLGGRIVSIFDKKYQREWLLQPSRPPCLAPPGAKFTDYDPHGWDEMLPTIDACAMPEGNVFAGQALPDHGDLWTQAWDTESNAEIIVLRVRGHVLPYELRRAAQIRDPQTLWLDYELRNLSDQSFPVLWTPHPLFSVQTGTAETRIVLPKTVTQVLSIAANAEWGESGRLLDWTKARSTSGWSLDAVGEVTRHSCRKFYLPPHIQVDHAELQDTSGATLRMSWQVDQLPYLGVWVDEGLFCPASNVAFEPGNGFYDSIERAWANKAAPMLLPGLPLKWSLQVTLGG